MRPRAEPSLQNPLPRYWIQANFYYANGEKRKQKITHCRDAHKKTSRSLQTNQFASRSTTPRPELLIYCEPRLVPELNWQTEQVPLRLDTNHLWRPVNLRNCQISAKAIIMRLGKNDTSVLNGTVPIADRQTNELTRGLRVRVPIM